MVGEFYLSPDVSTPLTEKKKAKSGKAAFMVTKTLDNLYKDYFYKSTESPLSSSLSKNCKLASAVKLNQCLCDACENISLKIQILDSKDKLKTNFEIMKIMLCPLEGDSFHPLQCIKIDEATVVRGN
ncbi:hypothetical protein PoB_004829500 [Plakobranchus ocellatus]|uniref:Uncharacterized protein n=1 Tax=Plakobranchus ocellatus TaxID=259542 RepID=A0AAV4BMM5_9GAST|nr:hypothetical protein PoB_004829500 [Plakobranchus ocellatus]